MSSSSSSSSESTKAAPKVSVGTQKDKDPSKTDIKVEDVKKPSSAPALKPGESAMATTEQKPREAQAELRTFSFSPGVKSARSLPECVVMQPPQAGVLPLSPAPLPPPELCTPDPYTGIPLRASMQDSQTCCSRCSQPVFHNECKRVNGRAFHKKCFTCANIKCRRPLEMINAYPCKEELFCTHCGPKCRDMPFPPIPARHYWEFLCPHVEERGAACPGWIGDRTNCRPPPARTIDFLIPQTYIYEECVCCRELVEQIDKIIYCGEPWHRGCLAAVPNSPLEQCACCDESCLAPKVCTSFHAIPPVCPAAMFYNNSRKPHSEPYDFKKPNPPYPTSTSVLPNFGDPGMCCEMESLTDSSSCDQSACCSCYDNSYCFHAPELKDMATPYRNI